MVQKQTSHAAALQRITQAGIAVQSQGKAYLLTGRGELLVGDLGNVAEADINRLSGLARSPMRAAFCTRRKCR